MKCRKAKKLVFEFIDGLKDDTKRLDLEKHLTECSGCDEFASQMTRSLDLLHRAPSEITSDNFAWKVRLKLNQERNVAGERSASYGRLIRSWNLRYAVTTVSAAAVVMVVGLYAVYTGLSPIPAADNYSQPVVREQPREESISSRDVAATEDTAPSPQPTQIPTVAERMSPRPRLGVTIPNRSTARVLASTGSSGESYSSPLLGLIDRPAPMSVAELDSIVNTELNGLTLEEQRQYLNQYIILLQRHLMKSMINRTNR